MAKGTALTFCVALVLALLCCGSGQGTGEEEASPHSCVHDTHLRPHLQNLQKQRQASLLAGFGVSEKDRRRQLQETAPVPIRIRPVYEIDGLDKLRQDFVRNQLIPATIRFFQQALSVKKPPSGPLLLQRICLRWRIWTSSNGAQLRECLLWDDLNCMASKVSPEYIAQYSTCTGRAPGECTTTPAGAGAPDTDFLLFVSAQDTNACAPPTLAHSAYCYQDPATDRPVAGNINLCPDSLSASPAAWQRQLAVAIHETIHALGFSDSLFEFFRDERGAVRTVVVAKTVERGSTVAKLVTPAVVATAQEHFGCPTLDGGELENNGGNGTAGSHWEARIFQNEAMLGVLGQSFVFSNMTLALLQDTGWYNVDYSGAQVLQSGNNAGCPYATASCVPPSMPAVFQPYYCDGSLLYQTGPNAQGVTEQRPVSQRCTFDNLAVGFCNQCSDGDSCETDGCTPITGYSNKLCTDPGNENSLDRTWGRHYGADARCFMQGSAFWVKGNQILSSSGAGCFRRRCEWPARGNATLLVEVGAGNWVKCVDNQEVSLTGAGFQQGRIGPCPVANEFCLYNTCPNDCSGLGTCYRGVCSCNPGFAGVDCSQRECSSNAECANGTSCDQASATCLSGGVISGVQACNATSDCPLGTACSPTTRTCTAGASSLVGAPASAPLQGSAEEAPYTVPSSNLTTDDYSPPAPTPPTVLVPAAAVGAPAAGGRPPPDRGVVIVSTVRFAGGDIAKFRDTRARMDFESNFTAQMADAVRAAGYRDQLQVVIDGIREGSILVDSTTALLKATTYTEADAFASTLQTTPGGVFASEYFLVLPAGAVTTANVGVSAAQSSTDAGGGGTDKKDPEWLGLSYIVWAIIGGVVLALFLCACLASNCKARQKAPPRPVFQRQNFSAGGVPPSLPREQYSGYSGGYPSSVPPHYSVPHHLHNSPIYGASAPIHPENDGVSGPLYPGPSPGGAWNTPPASSYPYGR